MTDRAKLTLARTLISELAMRVDRAQSGYEQARASAFKAGLCFGFAAGVIVTSIAWWLV